MSIELDFFCLVMVELISAMSWAGSYKFMSTVAGLLDGTTSSMAVHLETLRPQTQLNMNGGGRQLDRCLQAYFL